MLESSLLKLIPGRVSTFQKLENAEPYHFDQWGADRSGASCLYYWFYSGNRRSKWKKRVLVSEIRGALGHLVKSGALDRAAFRKVCPVSQSGGPCGFVVIGRIFEAIEVAQYSGRDEGFVLTDGERAKALLR